MFYSSYGSFMHRLIEWFYKGELTKEQMLIKFLFDFQKEVRGDRPSESIVRKYISCGTEYLKRFSPLPYRMIDVERRLYFTVDQYQFVGVLDYVGEKDGKIFIVDNKSRDLKPRSGRKTPTQKDMELDDMLRQLYLYAAAIKESFGAYPAALCFNCFKSGVFIEEPFSETAFQKTVDWARRTIEAIQNETDFPPYPDYFVCRYLCGVRDECCYAEGSDV